MGIRRSGRTVLSKTTTMGKDNSCVTADIMHVAETSNKHNKSAAMQSANIHVHGKS